MGRDVCAVQPEEGSCPGLIGSVTVACGVSPGHKSASCATSTSSAAIAELPGLGSPLSLGDRSRCLGQSPLEHPKNPPQQHTEQPAFRMAWKWPLHCHPPFTGSVEMELTLDHLILI